MCIPASKTQQVPHASVTQREINTTSIFLVHQSIQSSWYLTIQTASRQENRMFQNSWTIDLMVHSEIEVICFHKSFDQTFMFP